MIFSLLLILVLGMLANEIFDRLKLPGLLGMILVGILIGPHGLDLIEQSIMSNAADLRLIALVVILLRAGLGLNKHILQSVGQVSLKMSALPCLFEGFTVALVGSQLLHLPLAEAGMLGFIVAAVSPAVVVPSMLSLKEKGLGMQKGIPIIVLAGASIDDVFAITLFTTFLGMAMRSEQVVFLQIARIPLQIVGGILLGGLVGYLLYRLYNHRQVRLMNMQRLALIISAAFATLLLGEKYQLAGLLGVMTLGFVLLEKSNDIAVQLEKQLDKVWFFGQIFLFVLIGAELNVQVAWQSSLVSLAIIACGLLARALAVILALHGSLLNFREKLFCTVAYMPKATVQAAIGGIPLAMGIESGATILATAILAVVVTAPLGSIGIKRWAPQLLTTSQPESEGGFMGMPSCDTHS